VTGKARAEVGSCTTLISLANDNTANEPAEDVSRQPSRQHDWGAERRADKARIQVLEDRVQVLKQALVRIGRVEVGMEHLEDQQQAAEGWMEKLEHANGVALETLVRWGERWNELTASTSTTPAPPAYPAPAPSQSPPRWHVIPATPKSSQELVGGPGPQHPAPSLPPASPSTSNPTLEPGQMNSQPASPAEPHGSGGR
jgi:hypothetical protein